MVALDTGITYIIVFVATMIFTVISIWKTNEEVHFKWFAAVLWIIFAVVHFIVGDKTDSLTYAVAFLWLGIGLLFTVWGISTFFEAKKEKRLSFDMP